MCKSKKIVQQVAEAPAAAPPPAQPSAAVNQVMATNPDDLAPERQNVRNKRKGRNALRIDLGAGAAGATGLNVPQG